MRQELLITAVNLQPGRPIEEADLDLFSRFDSDAAASQPFDWRSAPCCSPSTAAEGLGP
jgi:hypothetical protein